MIAAALLAWAPPAEMSASQAVASQTVVAIFREACEQGSLNLTKRKGRILKSHEITDFMDVVDWSRVTSQHKVIALDYPRATYVIFAEYKELQPKSIANVCVVISPSISRVDAAAALREGTPNIEPKTTWRPNMYFPEWTIDLPKLGYRKRMKFWNDDSVLLEVAMYASSKVRPTTEVNK